MFSNIVVLYEIYSKKLVTGYFWHVSVHVYTASQINLFDIHQQKLSKENKFKITPDAKPNLYMIFFNCI